MSGINVAVILPLCTPHLRDTLSQTLRYEISEIELGDPIGEYPKPPEKEELIPPDFPISSKVVISVEVRFEREKT